MIVLSFQSTCDQYQLNVLNQMLCMLSQFQVEVIEQNYRHKIIISSEKNLNGSDHIVKKTGSETV